MKYNMKRKFGFENYQSRKDTGSAKWEKMYQANPNVDEDVVPMSIADMDFLCCEKIRHGLSEFVKYEILGYSFPTEEYYNSVINFYKNHYKIKIEEDWIVTSPGIVTALYTSVRAFTQPGDGVMVLTPIYPPFYGAIKDQNRRIEKCPLILENNRYEIDFDSFEKIASKKDVKMFLLCNPHNPSGRVWSEEELKKIDKIAEENNILVISDEIHSDIMLNGNQHTVYSKVSDHALDNSIICTSPSKSFNIAGLKNSNIFIKNKSLRSIFNKNMSNIGLHGTNMVGMKATELAYNHSDEWLDKLLEVIERNQKIIEDFFEPYGDKLKIMKAESTFLSWLDYSKLGVEPEEFMKFLEEDCQFFVNPGEMFGPEAKYFIRINVGLPTHKLEENLSRLRKGLKNRYNI